MTKDEFEKSYAEKSGMTVERLHKLGLVAIPCDCGEDSCKGWQMTSTEHLELLKELEERRLSEL